MRIRFFGGVFTTAVLGVLLLSIPLFAAEKNSNWSGLNMSDNYQTPNPTRLDLSRILNNKSILRGFSFYSSPGEQSGSTEETERPNLMAYVIVALSKMDMKTHPEDVSYFSSKEGTRVILEKIPLQAGAPEILNEEVPLPLVTEPISIMDYRIYEFEASLQGFETIHDRIVVTPGEFRKLSYTLVPRLDNRNEALWRSAVFSGWGQRYNGHQVSGWVFNVAQVAAIAFSAYAYIDYRNKYDDYDAAREDYLNAVGYSDVSRAKIKVENARDTLHDAAYLADYAFAVTGAIYAVNLLDIAFLGGGKVKVASGWKSGN